MTTTANRSQTLRYFRRCAIAFVFLAFLTQIHAQTPLSISTVNCPTVQMGVPYFCQLTATGGTPPYTWTVSALPSGLTLDPKTGVISGTVPIPPQPAPPTNVKITNVT
jgi:hypothetical protein